MNKHNHDDASRSQRRGSSLTHCPHCGKELSPWQQVILSVDRVLVCKNCWYKIILDVFDDKNKSGKS